MKGPPENQDRGAPAGGETFPVTGCATGGWGAGSLEGPGERMGSNPAGPEGAEPGYNRISLGETALSPLTPISV